MILSHPTLEEMLDIDDTWVTVLTVDNTRQMSAFIEELSSQISGNKGSFALFDDFDRISIPDNVRLLFNPFETDLQTKSLANGIVKEVKRTAVSERFYVRMNELFDDISRFASDVLSDVSLELAYEEPGISSLSKCWHHIICRAMDLSKKDSSNIWECTVDSRIRKSLFS